MPRKTLTELGYTWGGLCFLGFNAAVVALLVTSPFVPAGLWTWGKFILAAKVLGLAFGSWTWLGFKIEEWKRNA